MNNQNVSNINANEFFANLLHNDPNALKEIEASYKLSGIEDKLEQKLIKTIKRSVNPADLLSKTKSNSFRLTEKKAARAAKQEKAALVLPKRIPAGNLNAEGFLKLIREAGKAPSVEVRTREEAVIDPEASEVTHKVAMKVDWKVYLLVATKAVLMVVMWV